MMRAAMTHHVGQHPARTHGGQLVRVSDKQHAGTMGQRPKQGTCHVPVWGDSCTCTERMLGPFDKNKKNKAPNTHRSYLTLTNVKE